MHEHDGNGPQGDDGEDAHAGVYPDRSTADRHLHKHSHYSVIIYCNISVTSHTQVILPELRKRDYTHISNVEVLVRPQNDGQDRKHHLQQSKLEGGQFQHEQRATMTQTHDERRGYFTEPLLIRLLEQQF